MFQALVDQLTVAVVLFRAVGDDAGAPVDHEVAHANPAFTALAGAAPADLIGWRLSAPPPPGDLAGLLLACREAIAGGPDRAEYRAQDGRIFRTSVSSPAPGYVAVAFAGSDERASRPEPPGERERLYQTLFESTPDSVHFKDTEGRYVLVNSHTSEFLGLRPEQMIGKTALEVYPPEVADKIYRDDMLAMQTGLVLDTEDSFPNLGQQTLVRKVPVRDAEGKIIGLATIARDITERKRFEEALRVSERRFRSFVEHSGDGIIIANERGEVTEWNHAQEEITGLSREAALGQKLWDALIDCGASERRTDDTRERLRAVLTEALREGRVPPERQILERTVERPGGERRVIHIRTFPMHGEEGTHTLGAVVRDVTERRAAEDTLRRLSFHDTLTQLYNRAYFEEEMHRLGDGRHYPITIVLTDVDGLKLINDTMGHKAGDDLLRAYAGVLKRSFREGDVVARVGGDEFAVLLPSTIREVAESLAKRLEEAISSYNALYPQMPLSASVGLTTTFGPDVPLEVAFALADKQMYQDKLRRSVSASHGVVKALLTALAAKDYVTEGHTQRVRELSSMLGRAVGLSARQLSDLEVLAEVHDLGKVGIPDQILSKEGPLSDEEHELVKQHCVIGYRIAKAAPELAHVADLILHHHEWWNGGGYPNGLRGDDIPLLCRILAIADSFDAMTSDRPYRQGMSRTKALRELERCAGTQFDPVLAHQVVGLLGGAVLSSSDS